MKIESLDRLACPVPRCNGELLVDCDFSPATHPPGSELSEGILRCRNCAADYPVILGVALLLADLQEYLWGFWTEIQQWERRLPGVEISRRMLEYLGIASAHIGHAGPPPAAGDDLSWTVSPYLQVHGDRESLTYGLPGGWWRNLVEQYGEGGPDPYRFLLDAAGRHQSGDRDLMVEVGAGIGWGAAQMAGDYAYSIGLDWSFTAVLTARRYFLSSPCPIEQYAVETEKGSFIDRPLKPQKVHANLDFAVADGAGLPLGDGRVPGLAALNVLCAVPEPTRLFAEFARVVRSRGLLLLSTPYWADASGEGDSAFARGGPTFTRSALRSEFGILEEADMVPWLVRLAQRRWNVYLSHCLVAERR